MKFLLCLLFTLVGCSTTRVTSTTPTLLGQRTVVVERNSLFLDAEIGKLEAHRGDESFNLEGTKTRARLEAIELLKEIAK